MESVNWVCEEVQEKHEWVSPLTISMKEEEVLMELDHELDVPCVVQWRFLWFIVPQLAIESAINVPDGGHVTPRTRLLESIAVIMDRLSEEDWDLDKEMIGWELGDSFVLPLVLSCLWKKS